MAHLTRVLHNRKSNDCVVGLRLTLRAGYPKNSGLIAEKDLRFSEAHSACYSMDTGGYIIGRRQVGAYPSVDPEQCRHRH
jgi:hypothetical protein